MINENEKKVNRKKERGKVQMGKVRKDLKIKEKVRKKRRETKK